MKGLSSTQYSEIQELLCLRSPDPLVHLHYFKTLLSKPKLNENLSSTEFEVRLHSYSDIHPPHPTTHPGTHHVVVVVNWPGRVGQRHTVQLYTHTQVSASLHCISERLTFLFSKAWDFENFWLRIQKYCGYGQKGYSLGPQKKISEFGAIFFKITPGGKIRSRGQV